MSASPGLARYSIGCQVQKSATKMTVRVLRQGQRRNSCPIAVLALNGLGCVDQRGAKMPEPENALYRCKDCGEEWVEELPPLWLGAETWPTHCQLWANLIMLVVTTSV